MKIREELRTKRDKCETLEREVLEKRDALQIRETQKEKREENRVMECHDDWQTRDEVCFLLSMYCRYYHKIIAKIRQ